MSYIVERGRQLVRRDDPLQAISAENTTKYDLTAHATIGPWTFTIRTGDRFYVGTSWLGKDTILVCKGLDITVKEADLDTLYDVVLPALEQELVLDELADI